MRLTRPFVLLALAVLLAPHVEASRTSVWGSNPPASLKATKTDAAGLLASLAPAAAADIEAEEPPVFNLGDIVLVDTANADAENFGLGPLTLVDLNLLRGPPPSYPETRVRGFELLPPFRVGASPTLSLWRRQACGAFSCGLVSDSPEDPWGLKLGDWWDPRTYADPELAKDMSHDLLNLASLGTLSRVEKQKNLGTLRGLGESLFNGARSVSNAASFGLQDQIYETQMREGPGLGSTWKGVQNTAYDLLPMEEIRSLAQDDLSGGEKAALFFTAASKTAGLVAGAKAAGEAGAVRYYRSRVTATYQRAVTDYEAQGLSPQRVGQQADKATKRWAQRNLEDFSQQFDPQTRRTYSDGYGAAQPDILLPEYGEGLELKTTFDAAWRAETQYGRFIDLFPEFNIEYVLGKGGWVSSTGTPISLRSYQRGVLATAVQQGAGR
ncbi:MAG: hypothetical protein IPP07_24035 [Holophagales bacterium]|nr:hypothetical protein [Holophagales bacterium]